MEQPLTKKPKYNSAGFTKYPIKEGVVFKLKAIRNMFNRQLNAKADHISFLWIQRFNTGKYKCQPKKRLIRVCFVDVPCVSGMEHKSVYRVKSVQLRYIGWLLREGYEIVAENCKFNYSEYAYFNFYKKIGLIDERAIYKKTSKGNRR